VEARYEVRSVDGDGNRSGLAVAELVAGDPESYTALGGFGPTQGAGQWKYEGSVGGGGFRELRWENGGYEGRWVGSGLAAVGRIWMQPGAQADVSRTFIAPANGSLTISGSIRKDPSAENGHPIRARLLHNEQQVWPANGWAEVMPDYAKTIDCRLESLPVAEGDSVRFVLEHSGHIVPDPVVWNPTVMICRRT
jgi:hypothetical protein